jgi:hypothetical protein
MTPKEWRERQRYLACYLAISHASYLGWREQLRRFYADHGPTKPTRQRSKDRVQAGPPIQWPEPLDAA